MAIPSTWAQLTQVNPEKVWNVLRRTDREDLLVMLVRALRSIQASQLEPIFADYAHPHEVGDIEVREPVPLLDAVREFTEAALRGDFYQDFRLNSHSCMDRSCGTQDFEARLDLIFDRCVEAASCDPAEVCAAYEMLFGLLREIDKFEKDIVFFADEGGVWQFFISWRKVLPAYFQCLAKTAGRDDFERQAAAVIEEFVDAHERGKLRNLVATTRHPT